MTCIAFAIVIAATLFAPEDHATLRGWCIAALFFGAFACQESLHITHFRGKDKP